MEMPEKIAQNNPPLRAVVESNGVRAGGECFFASFGGKWAQDQRGAREWAASS
jgi:hypothetical protein